MAVLRNASAFLPAQVEELLPAWQLHRSAVALSSFRRKVARFLPPTDTFGGSRGHLPAIVHQTWKTDDHGDHDDDNGGGSSGGESDQLWDRRIDAWDDVGLNAGVPGKSATDAWHATALDIEFAQTKGLAFAGGSLDIYKCFDQLNRDLIYRLAARAGMPTGIFHAYKQFA